MRFIDANVGDKAIFRGAVPTLRSNSIVTIIEKWENDIVDIEFSDGFSKPCDVLYLEPYIQHTSTTFDDIYKDYVRIQESITRGLIIPKKYMPTLTREEFDHSLKEFKKPTK